MTESGSSTESFKVVPPELIAAAQAVRTLLDGLTTGFASLDTDIDTLTATWHGRQGTLFSQGYAEVREGLAELLDAMRDTTVALNTSAEAYLAQQRVNADAIESVASSLDLPDVS
ncbi:WXG100 family type VII secretion target [Nocardia lijiangensis]|uniref:WXG100 family type VII secretion target n=1 Tax=Nocardia lijiangensis TaxID=299618 RepID=UPI000833835B|nr:WXG100 family type VII secretion target [Nocardia lijiangensis]